MTDSIIKGREIPDIRRPGAKPRYPWIEMKPGDAFKFADGVKWTTATSSASKRGFDYAMKFVVRKEQDGIYCYRVDGLDNSPHNANLREEIEAAPRTPTPAQEVETVGWLGENEPENEDEI